MARGTTITTANTFRGNAGRARSTTKRPVAAQRRVFGSSSQFRGVGVKTPFPGSGAFPRFRQPLPEK